MKMMHDSCTQMQDMYSGCMSILKLYPISLGIKAALGNSSIVQDTMYIACNMSVKSNFTFDLIFLIHED